MIKFSKKDNGGIKVYDANGDFSGGMYYMLRIVKVGNRNWELLGFRPGGKAEFLAGECNKSDCEEVANRCFY